VKDTIRTYVRASNWRMGTIVHWEMDKQF
jgi:hypothetical protein